MLKNQVGQCVSKREGSLIRNFLAIILSLFLFLSTFAPYISASTSLTPYKAKRPIPPSPAPIDQPEKSNKPKELPNKRTKYSKKYSYPDGLFITKSYPKAIHKKGEKGGWEDINPNEDANQLFLMVDPIPLSLCLYGAGSSFDENGTKSGGVIDLVGIANLCKAIALTEWNARGLKNLRNPGKVLDPNNIMNCHQGSWEGENRYSSIIDNNFWDLEYSEICGSEFLSAIAGVSVLFYKANVIEGDGSLQGRSETNKSVFFWFEAARRFNGGGPNKTNDMNRAVTKEYIDTFKRLNGSRYLDPIDQYLKYLKKLKK